MVLIGVIGVGGKVSSPIAPAGVGGFKSKSKSYYSSEVVHHYVIERKYLSGVMSKDCKDTLQTLKSDKTRVRRKVRTEYLSDAIVGRADEIRKTSDEQFRLQLTSKGRQ